MLTKVAVSDDRKIKSNTLYIFFINEELDFRSKKLINSNDNDMKRLCLALQEARVTSGSAYVHEYHLYHENNIQIIVKSGDGIKIIDSSIPLISYADIALLNVKYDQASSNPSQFVPYDTSILAMARADNLAKKYNPKKGTHSFSLILPTLDNTHHFNFENEKNYIINTANLQKECVNHDIKELNKLTQELDFLKSDYTQRKAVKLSNKTNQEWDHLIVKLDNIKKTITERHERLNAIESGLDIHTLSAHECAKLIKASLDNSSDSAKAKIICALQYTALEYFKYLLCNYKKKPIELKNNFYRFFSGLAEIDVTEANTNNYKIKFKNISSSVDILSFVQHIINTCYNYTGYIWYDKTSLLLTKNLNSIIHADLFYSVLDKNGVITSLKINQGTTLIDTLAAIKPYNDQLLTIKKAIRYNAIKINDEHSTLVSELDFDINNIKKDAEYIQSAEILIQNDISLKSQKIDDDLRIIKNNLLIYEAQIDSLKTTLNTEKCINENLGITNIHTNDVLHTTVTAYKSISDTINNEISICSHIKIGSKSNEAIDTAVSCVEDLKQEWSQKKMEIKKLKQDISMEITSCKIVRETELNNRAARIQQEQASQVIKTVELIKSAILNKLNFWNNQVNYGGGAFIVNNNTQYKVPYGIAKMAEACRETNNADVLFTSFKNIADQATNRSESRYCFFKVRSANTAKFYHIINSLNKSTLTDNEVVKRLNQLKM
ncbi:MAG: hypothetical protein P4M12_06130 [Gammaproteobacteria bacterium]|nr:hypothetical protein [Gammaproteobacteria bacterium]